MKALSLKRKFAPYRQGDIIEFVLKGINTIIDYHWKIDYRVVLDKWEFISKDPPCEKKDRVSFDYVTPDGLTHHWTGNPCRREKDLFSLDYVQFSGLTEHWICAEEIPISGIRKSRLRPSERVEYNKRMKDLKSNPRTHYYIR